jgi:peptide/nickel transport system permease protein
MLRYTVRRCAAMPLLLVLSSFVIFTLMYLTPGDPLRSLFGGHEVAASTEAALKARYHLNESFLGQYFTWLWEVLRGNLGQSIVHQESVSSIVGPRIVPTIELAGLALAEILLVGVSLGVLAAVHHGRIGDRVASSITLVLSAIPAFISSLVLIMLFAIDVHWFPAIGLGGGGWERVHHLVLPSLALAGASVALVARSTRAGMAQALAADFIDTLRSRGLGSRRIVLKYAFRHALLPVATITGLVAGYLVSGAVIVETAFGLNGIGAQLIYGVEEKDFAVVQAIALLMVLAFLAVNLLVDLLYGVIDPRVRLTAART